MKIHIVQSDDSLAKLAEKYQISEDQIVKANPRLEKDQTLKVGSKIYIPSGKIPLIKEEEKRDDSLQKENNTNHDFEQNEFSIESSYRQEFDSDTRMQFEDDDPEPVPFPVGWAPYPSAPAQFWGCSYYPMVPPNPYFSMEPVGGMAMPPYYFYPYTYGSYFQNGEDIDRDSSFFRESSSYYRKSDWKPNWLEKESSSVEG